MQAYTIDAAGAFQIYPRSPYYRRRGAHPLEASGFWDDVWGGVKTVVNVAKPVLDAGKTAIAAAIPGYGTAIAAGVGALQGAAEGKKWYDIGLDAVSSAVPGGAGGKAAFEAARGAITAAAQGGGWQGALAGAAGGAVKGALSETAMRPELQALLSGGTKGLVALGLSRINKTAAGKPPVRPAPSGATLPGQAVAVATRLLENPELRKLAPGALARQLRVSLGMVQQAQAAIMQAVRSGGALSPGDVREVSGLTTLQVIERAARPVAAALMAPKPTKPRFGLAPMSLIDLVRMQRQQATPPRPSFALAPMSMPTLVRMQPQRAKPVAGRRPVIPRPRQAAGFDANPKYWIVQAGEYPSAICKKITGSTNLTQKLVLANGPDGYPDGLKRTLVQESYGWNFKFLKAGDRLRLPVEFDPYLAQSPAEPAPPVPETAPIPEWPVPPEWPSAPGSVPPAPVEPAQQGPVEPPGGSVPVDGGSWPFPGLPAPPWAPDEPPMAAPEVPGVPPLPELPGGGALPPAAPTATHKNKGKKGAQLMLGLPILAALVS